MLNNFIYDLLTTKSNCKWYARKPAADYNGVVALPSTSALATNTDEQFAAAGPSVGFSGLCRHFFENNRQALAFENNASILGGICSILGEKPIYLSLIDSLLLICV